MPNFFIHPNGAYFETDDDVALSDQPLGTISVPKRPSLDHVWQSGSWSTTSIPIEDRRSVAVLDRWDLFKKLRDAGIISPDEAVSAANGGVVPSSLLPTINAMPEPYRSDVLLDFGGFKVAHRNHPLVTMMASLHAPPLTPTEIDAIFGIT